MGVPYRKLSLIAKASAQKVKAFALRLYDRVRLTRPCQGLRLIVPLTASCTPAGAQCCCCSEIASTKIKPVRSLRVALGPVPAVEIPLCDRCAAQVAKHARFELAIAGLGVVLGLSGFTTLFAFRPWSSWPWSSVVVALSCALALLGRLARVPVPVGILRWLGSPACWRKRVQGAVVLDTPSLILASNLRQSATPVLAESCTVVERDGSSLLLCSVAVALVLAPLLWREAHPIVRVINLGIATVDVSVDGHAMGRLPPSWTEAPGTGIEVRVPIGWRVFEARDEHGIKVDSSRGWVSRDQRVVYAPAHAPFCLWVERRGYGTTPAPHPTVLRLAEGQTLYSLSEPLDAWFQPNPARDTSDRWFSGGIRRALRYGPCASTPGP